MSDQQVPLTGHSRPLHVTSSDEPGAGFTGAALADVIDALQSAVDLLPAVDEVVHQASTRDLLALNRLLLAVMQLAETGAVRVTADTIQRGLVKGSTAAGPAQFVARLAAGDTTTELLPTESSSNAGPLVPVDDPADHAGPAPAAASEASVQVPGIEPGHAARIARVAAATLDRRNSVMRDALNQHLVSVTCADTATTHVEKVMPVLPALSRDEVLGHYLSLAPGAGTRQLRELTKRVIATYTTPDSLEDADARSEAAESLSWRTLPGGMTQVVIDLTDLHAAQLRQAINALSAPAPGNTCCANPLHRHTGGQPTGDPDPRGPGKRRADAFMLLVTKAAELIDTDGGVQRSGKATLVVTIDLDTLTGKLPGYARTEDGHAINPHLIRHLACDANILPMVLGTGSQPLDVGTTKRLVTGELRRAVIERDRHCTYPGCAALPSWCDAHHITPWHMGGPTTLTNTALLCRRHHTVVHRDQLMATVTTTGVIWDPTPGRMPNAHPESAA